ncbi:MAG: hypothetical protein FWG93_05065, partial [Oscillospiraceae bacterium]|nr:hypothetical protein [Oscillospiraceae bacterium]
MDTKIQPRSAPDGFFHFARPRLNKLLEEGVQSPLVIVCAGAGTGKTAALRDFTRGYRAAVVWLQISERDNVGARFWESFTRAVAAVNEPFAAALRKLGFPGSGDKLSQYTALTRKYDREERRVVVLDDFHRLEDPAVLAFLQQAIAVLPEGMSLVLASRATPRVDVAGL